MRKKVMTSIMAICMSMALAACGSSAQSSSSADTPVSSGSSAAQEAGNTTGSSTAGAAQEAGNTVESSTAGTGNGSDSLIVYFDYSENMGDTSAMSADAITSASLAGMTIDGITENDLLVMRDEIRRQTGADVFSVRVTEPYDPDYNTMVGVAQEDQDNNKQFTFVEDLPDLSGYSTIYMGMPVWWGGLPQPMVCLLDQYDFSGKTIIPFGINLGSGFGRMITQIEEAEPDATVNENGLTENAHTPNAEVVSDVDSWLAGLE